MNSQTLKRFSQNETSEIQTLKARINTLENHLAILEDKAKEWEEGALKELKALKQETKQEFIMYRRYWLQEKNKSLWQRLVNN